MQGQEFRKLLIRCSHKFICEILLGIVFYGDEVVPASTRILTKFIAFVRLIVLPILF